MELTVEGAMRLKQATRKRRNCRRTQKKWEENKSETKDRPEKCDSKSNKGGRKKFF